MSSSEELFNQLQNFSATKSQGVAGMTKLKPSERLLQDIKSYGFNMNELEGVLKTRGNQLIVSCAGSGKTTALIFKINYDLKSGRATRVVEVNGNPIRVPDKILVSTFLRTGANELADSFRKWEYKLHCADMSQAIQFSTLHAEFRKALVQMGVDVNLIDDTENTKYLREVVNGYKLKNSNGMSLNSEDVNNLFGALTYTRNRLDNKRYINPVYDDLRITQKIIDAILFDWKAKRMSKGLMDFEDLQERLYMECYERKNQDAIKFLSKRYNYIYIDEFQDTSQIQYAVLKIYCSGCKQVVAIGDDDQTIYSWRGSDNTIITNKFMQDFSPTKSSLSVNFRCPSNVLDAIVPSIQRNKSRFDKNLKSYRKGGKLQYGEYTGYHQMAMALGNMVYDDVKEGKSVAVLCRVNSDGLLPALFFDKIGKFSFSVSGSGMTLDSYIGRTAISIIKLFTERATPAVKKALSQLTWDDYCISALMRTCKENKLSIWTISENDLTYSCPSIADIILNWRSWREANGEIYALKLVLQEYRYQVYKKESQFNDVMRSVLMGIESLLDSYQYETVEDFLADLEDINGRLKAREKKKNVNVHIATVHEFKGKEADCVYVWNDSEDVFPYKLSMGSLEEIEEERRVHYIANTRAKEKNTIMYIKAKKGMFVEEMDLSAAEKLIQRTSGSFKKALEEKIITDSGLRKFKDAVSVDTGTFDDDEEEIEYEQAIVK